MHTFNGKAVTIHYNSDMSSDVFLSSGTDDDRIELCVPAQDLLDFVAAYVRLERISKLEQASAAEVLGL